MLDTNNKQFYLPNVLYMLGMRVNLISLCKAHNAGVHYSRTKACMHLSTLHLKLDAAVPWDCSTTKLLARTPRNQIRKELLELAGHMHQ